MFGLLDQRKAAGGVRHVAGRIGSGSTLRGREAEVVRIANAKVQRQSRPHSPGILHVGVGVILEIQRRRGIVEYDHPERSAAPQLKLVVARIVAGGHLALVDLWHIIRTAFAGASGSVR